MSSAEATLRMLLVGVDKGASKMFRDVGRESEGAGGKTSKFKVAAVAGLAAAGAAAVAFGKKSVDAYRDAAKESAMLSRVTGLTIKESSQLRFAAEESGVEFNTLSTSTRIFSKNLSAAGSSTKKMSDLTKQLGFSVKDAHGNLLPMSDLLPKVADRFKTMPDGPEKTALAMKLFGRSGADMIKVLNKGSEGLADFAKESDKTGNTLSNVDGYKKTVQAQREFHAATQGLQVQIGAALMPILTVLALFLAQHVAPAITSVTHFVTEHQAVISHVAPILAILVGAFLGLVGILKVFRSVMAGVNIIMSANPIALVIIALVALGIGLVVAYKKSETFRDIVNGVFRAVGSAASFMWNNVLKPVFKLWLDTWFTIVGALVNGAANAFGWVPGIGGKLKAAADKFNDFRDRVNNALDGIHSEKDIHLKVTTTQSVQVSSINKPRRTPGGSAVGARFLAGGFERVGERGPEIAWFPRGTSISTAADSSRMTAGSGSGDLGTVTLILKGEDGKTLEQKFIKFQRDQGGRAMAFVTR